MVRYWLDIWGYWDLCILFIFGKYSILLDEWLHDCILKNRKKMCVPKFYFYGVRKGSNYKTFISPAINIMKLIIKKVKINVKFFLHKWNKKSVKRIYNWVLFIISQIRREMRAHLSNLPFTERDKTSINSKISGLFKIIDNIIIINGLIPKLIVTDLLLRICMGFEIS